MGKSSLSHVVAISCLLVVITGVQSSKSFCPSDVVCPVNDGCVRDVDCKTGHDDRTMCCKSQCVRSSDHTRKENHGDCPVPNYYDCDLSAPVPEVWCVRDADCSGGKLCCKDDCCRGACTDVKNPHY